MANSLSRRALLASLSALLATPVLGQAKGKSVIVVGAGLAGLTAARDLAAAGAQVTVLEARDRIAAQISRWSVDPFAMGAFSFLTPGTSPKTRQALAGSDWDGRLHFAGEATEPDYPSTAHGAVLSGRRAAAALIG